MHVTFLHLLLSVVVANTGTSNFPGTSYSHFSELKLTSDAGPSSIVYFTAVFIDQRVRLSWNTEKESGINLFEVERSVDGVNFQSIHAEPAKNNGGENNYIFFDTQELAGNISYRVKIQPESGNAVYSYVNTVMVRRPADLKIVPNLVADNINVFHARAKPGAKIEIYSFDGRRMSQVNVAKDAVQTNLNVASMLQGTYNLVYVDLDNVEFVKFIKQ